MLTADELDRRRHFVTATDVAKILNYSPWGNGADVYMEKIHGRQVKSNDAMAAGNLLEPAVMEWAHRELGGVLAGDWRVHENGINAASLDGLTVSGEPVEAKTSGITGPGTPHQWGVEGSDEIPDYYLLQVHAQLLVTGARRAWVPALIGGRGFVMFMVDRNDAVCESIRLASEEFWRLHIVERVMPEKQPRLETLKGIRRSHGKSVEIAEDLARRYLDASAAAKAAAKAEEEAKAALLAAMGDAEIGVTGSMEFSFREQTRKGFTVEESTFRVLRHKSIKRGMVTV